MGFWKSLKDLGKTVGEAAPGVAPVIESLEEGRKARQKSKQEKRARRTKALSAVASTFTNPFVLAALAIGVLVFLFFAPPESKKSLMDFLKFFTG